VSFASTVSTPAWKYGSKITMRDWAARVEEEVGFSAGTVGGCDCGWLRSSPALVPARGILASLPRFHRENGKDANPLTFGILRRATRELAVIAGNSRVKGEFLI
jgi:hypothetical protein